MHTRIFDPTMSIIVSTITIKTIITITINITITSTIIITINTILWSDEKMGWLHHGSDTHALAEMGSRPLDDDNRISAEFRISASHAAFPFSRMLFSRIALDFLHGRT